MRGRAARLVSLVAAAALALAPIAVRAHLAATAALGLYLCTTPVEGKAPAGAAHGEHCECCASASAAPPPGCTPAVSPPAAVPCLAGADHSTTRAAIIPVPPPRGPPTGSFSTH
jgi:hypothetical protein